MKTTSVKKAHIKALEERVAELSAEIESRQTALAAYKKMLAKAVRETKKEVQV